MQFHKRMYQLFSKFHRVSTDDVKKTILSSLSKSCTLDHRPNFLVQNYIDILFQPICSIVNLSLLEGVVIDIFKHAVLTSLIKKPFLDADELLNYRLVSGLNFISKTIERVVSKHHLTVNELDNINQSAYTQLILPCSKLLTTLKLILLRTNKPV